MIEGLTPKMQVCVRDFLELLDEMKFNYAILEGLRTAARQASLYAQGREPIERINSLRILSGYRQISEAEAKRIVTWTKHSKHQDGLAIDIAPVLPDGRIPWVVRDQATADLWLTLGKTGESCGLTWGGRWPEIDKWGLGKDLPHFEKAV